MFRRRNHAMDRILREEACATRRAREAAPAVREEKLSGRILTSWRGQSGKRYLAEVRGLDAIEALSMPVVVLAVHRNAAGTATLVSVAAIKSATALAGFGDLARMAGATEIHVHTLAIDAAARAAIFRDLAPGAAYRPAAGRAPLAVAGRYDRRAIMAAACAVARVRQGLTGEAWGACMGAALRGAWAAARAARLASAH